MFGVLSMCVLCKWKTTRSHFLIWISLHKKVGRYASAWSIYSFFAFFVGIEVSKMRCKCENRNKIRTQKNSLERLSTTKNSNCLNWHPFITDGNLFSVFVFTSIWHSHYSRSVYFRCRRFNILARLTLFTCVCVYSTSILLLLDCIFTSFRRALTNFKFSPSLINLL